MTEHEHVFVEEQEPNGRLILPPCIVCDLTAMDAIETLKQERTHRRDPGPEVGRAKRLWPKFKDMRGRHIDGHE